MGSRPTINLIDNPVAVGEREDPAAANPTPTNQESNARLRRRRVALPERLSHPESEEPRPAQPATNPYAGMRKVQAPVRLFPPLWDHLETLVRELQADGHEVDKTALLNAVLHFHGPRDAAAARDLVNQWRALLARPPAPRR